MSPLIHIGYHKTASTWLQREVFPSLPSVGFVGDDDALMSSSLRSIAGSGPSPFLPKSLREQFAERERAMEHPLLVSFEGLSGSVFGRGLDGPTIAERLALVAPEGRILLITRRQQEMIPSLYRQYVQQGGVASFTSFVDGDPLPGSRFDASHLEFDRLLSTYEKHFDGQVFAVPYELLQSAPTSFREVLGAFAGVPPDSVALPRTKHNISLGWPLVRVLRAWNVRFRQSPLNPTPRVRPIRWSPRGTLQRRVNPLVRRLDRSTTPPEFDVPRRIVDVYRASNRRLQELSGHELGTLGYAL